ncbi:MAG: RNA 2',3'-cyclic phosphodiesterase [Chloroflexales bacterium]|nr:RNA 2',3'-cyclic phosphodiesterase [Chloroflexales bacterium]
MTMRLFVALDVPEAIIAELSAIQQRLRRNTDRAVSWVKPAAIHLTLQFLGEVDSERIPAILAALEAIQQNADTQRSRILSLAPIGAFPNLRRPQTIWAGVGGDLAALERLYHTLASALELLGFSPETRPFRAHLTLGRVRREATEYQRAALGAAIAALSPPHPITWQSGSPILYQSTLTPQGAIYQALGP